MIPRIKNNFVRHTGTGKSWSVDMDPLTRQSYNGFEKVFDSLIFKPVYT
jgi:hypothetical protein